MSSILSGVVLISILLVAEVRASCLPTIPLVLEDIHDSNQKVIKSVEWNTFVIQSYPNTTQWEVKGQWDINCEALVNFNVPGKEDPPPGALKMAMWVMQSDYMSTAVKLGFEFSDPTGQLAPRNEPINMWISSALSTPTHTKIDDVKLPSKNLHGSTCLYTPHNQAEVFDDMHDSDKKAVLVKGSDLTIKPYDNKEEWVIESKFTEGCVASVNFDVPGKPSPPPYPLTLSIWGMASIAGAVKDAMIYTEPDAPLGSPLNIWVPSN